MAWGQFTEKKSCHLLCTAKHRRLGSDLLHGPNRFGRSEANKIKNSCCLNKVMQRHGFSVFTLILVSVYISRPKVVLANFHCRKLPWWIFSPKYSVSFSSSFLVKKKIFKYLIWMIETGKCKWEGKFYCKSSITLLNKMTLIKEIRCIL